MVKGNKAKHQGCLSFLMFDAESLHKILWVVGRSLDRYLSRRVRFRNSRIFWRFPSEAPYASARQDGNQRRCCGLVCAFGLSCIQSALGLRVGGYLTL